MIGLTPQQAKCLRFIRDYIRDNDGAAPSYTEIMLELDLSSKSRVHALVTLLEERGAIVRLPGQSRAIAVVEPEARFAEDLRALSDEAFAGALDIVAAEIARRAEAAA